MTPHPATTSPSSWSWSKTQPGSLHGSMAHSPGSSFEVMKGSTARSRVAKSCLHVVMGERMELDQASTDLTQRLPLPVDLALSLSLHLALPGSTRD